MKLALASSYAIHAMAFMAEQSTDRVVACHEIAQARGMPEHFLMKALKPLVHQQIIVSGKGPNGGYCLARSANKITLLEILEATEGPLHGTAPMTEHADAEPLDRKLAAIAQRLTEGTRRQLQGVTLAQLVSKGAKAK